MLNCAHAPCAAHALVLLRAHILLQTVENAAFVYGRTFTSYHVSIVLGRVFCIYFWSTRNPDPTYPSCGVLVPHS